MGNLKFKISRSIYSAFIIILFIGFAFATTETDNNSSSERTTDHSIEYKLAVIDGYSTPSNELTRKYGHALDLLERYCPEDRERIADMTVASQQELKKKNIDESLLQLLRNFRTSIPEEAKPGEIGECSEIFSAYIVLRINSNQ